MLVSATVAATRVRKPRRLHGWGPSAGGHALV